MIRKIAILLLLCVCAGFVSKAQLTDNVTISMPPYTDTTCPGTQLTFWATVTGDSTPTYQWFVNNVPTTVTQDSFFTTAPGDSSWIYCIIHFTNSFGVPSVDTSNWIIVHRDTLPSRALISLVAGNNPYCSMGPMTFFVYPIRGGRLPLYQWFVNGVPVVDADSNYFTGTFADSSVITCLMVADTTCYRNVDSVYSNTIMVIRDSLTATISISNRYDTVCFGRLDTFTAVSGGYESSTVHYQWFIDTTAVPGATASMFYTDSLHNGDSVYCIMTTFDTCIRNKIQRSNVIRDSVSPILHTIVSTALTMGSNPGCIDSPVQYEGFFLNFGNNPTFIWYLNGTQVRIDTAFYTSTFHDSDSISFVVYGTDRTCRDRDTLSASAIIMMRDSTPQAPIISLIGDLLVANDAGTYKWYGPGGLIPGATGQTYHPTVLGNYYAQLDTGHCLSGISNILYVSLLDVNSVPLPHMRLYPNPTTGKVVLDWNGSPETVQVAVFDMVGKKVWHDDVRNRATVEADLSAYPDGTYFIEVRNLSGYRTTYKLLLAR
jgi:hypothetical protein